MKSIEQAVQSVKFVFRWNLLSALSGLLAGIAASMFLLALDWATKIRILHSYLIWGLPVAGFFIGWIYHRYGSQIAKGSNLIIDEIHEPKRILPFRLAPLVFLATVLTHLFGGSAGREGTVVQMGASLSDQLNHFFKLGPLERRVLLMAGMGAGFGVALGAPWAGMVFGIEVIRFGRHRFAALYPCAVASFVSYYTSIQLGVLHSEFFEIQVPPFNLKILIFVALAGALFGAVAKVFIASTHFFEHQFAARITYPPFRPSFGGILLILFIFLEGSFRYTGLGIPFIQQAFKEIASFADPIYKTFFTVLTISSGFKGGEFVPLVYIGATLGSALSVILPISFQLLAGVGFVAVFAGAANVPLACSVLAMELFGLSIGPYAFLACFMSYLFSGSKGLYKTHRDHDKKIEIMNTLFKKMNGKIDFIMNRKRSHK